MPYKVTLEYKKLWKDGRMIKNPKWKKETAIFNRKNNIGILRGATSYPKHFRDVFGSRNVRNISIKKLNNRGRRIRGSF